MPLPPPMSPGGVPLADFGNRLLAYLIDTAILVVAQMVVVIPAFIIFITVFASRADFEVDPNTGEVTNSDFSGFFGAYLLLWAVIILVSVVFTYIYFVEMMWRTGQTVGKRVIKLRVIPIDPRARLTRGIVAKRWAVQFIVGVVVPLFSYLDGFWQLWDKPFLQTLHDKAAQTVVIKVSA
jgi:uncharacterized RDD family membrane protein YckC